MRRTHVYCAGDAQAPVIYLNVFEGDGSDVWEACRNLGCSDFSLVAVSDLSWDADLSPWPAEPQFSGDHFEGKADAYLEELAQEIIPAAEEEHGLSPAWRGIAGYSLAGLFAVYVLYKTDLFRRAVTASGSFWFPGFLEYAMTHEMAVKPDAVYMSLGSKESKVRNPVLAKVEENTKELQAYFSGCGIHSVYETNPGNHFREPALRTAKGIQWILSQEYQRRWRGYLCRRCV